VRSLRSQPILVCACLALLAPRIIAQSSDDAPAAEEPEVAEAVEPAAPDAPDFHPNEVRTMRPKIWDEPPEANGVFTSRNAVIPAGLSLGRARRGERAQVDAEELADRQERMLDGERFTQRLRALPEGDEELEARSEVEVAEARAGEPMREGTSILSIASAFIALGGFVALLWTRLRSR
jgi:hypothetical protein